MIETKATNIFLDRTQGSDSVRLHQCQMHWDECNPPVKRACGTATNDDNRCTRWMTLIVFSVRWHRLNVSWLPGTLIPIRQKEDLSVKLM